MSCVQYFFCSILNVEAWLLSNCLECTAAFILCSLHIPLYHMATYFIFSTRDVLKKKVVCIGFNICIIYMTVS
jgi:hypothetical protein